MIARQLTAFLPADYPLAEESPNGEAHGKRQGKLKVLLLENINVDAANYLKASGFQVGRAFPRGSMLMELLYSDVCPDHQVDHVTKAFNEDELIDKLPNYHAVGIRSKTRMTARVIDACPQVSSQFDDLGR